LWILFVLLFNKKVTKCGGVNEDKIGVLAVVSPSISMVYKRFSMRDPAKSL